MNDLVAVYFADPTIASAFVARWCSAQKVEIADGMFRFRDGEPTPRTVAALHKTPRSDESPVLLSPESVSGTATGVGARLD